MYDRDEKQGQKRNAGTKEFERSAESPRIAPGSGSTRRDPAGSDTELLHQIAAGAQGSDYAAHIERLSGQDSSATSATGAAPRSLGAYEYATGKPMPSDTAGQARRQTSLAIGQTQDSSSAPRGPAPATAITPDVDTLDFTTAVGRPTLPERVTLENATDRAIGIGARIEPVSKSPAFIVCEGDGIFAPPLESNRQRAAVAVRFFAPTPGRHAATLVVTHDLGVLRIPLTGTALDLGAHARTEAQGGGPEPIHALPEQAPPHTMTQERSQLLDSADALSSLAATFDQTVAPGDDAARELGDRIIAAGAELHQRILDWAVDEAGDQVHKASEKAAGAPGTEFLKSLIVSGVFKGADKAVGALTEEDPGALLAVKAIEWGYEIVGKVTASGEEGERAEGFDRHMEGVAFFGGRALDGATGALARGFAGVMSRYQIARGRLEDEAGQDPNKLSAGYALGEVRDRLREIDRGRPDRQVVEKVLHDARRVLMAFQKSQTEWADALRAIAAAGSEAEEVANAGFGALIDRYIQFKSGGGTGNMETRGGEVRATGTIDFRSPANIQLEGFTFGRFVDPSATVDEHIRGKTLAELAGWDVHIELRGVYEGSLVLHQGPVGPAQRDATPSPGLAGQLELLGGAARVWQLLDTATLGTRVIWVPQ